MLNIETNGNRHHPRGNTMSQSFFGVMPVISIYTRSEAIADGSLFDVTPDALKCGFTLNTCLTASLMHYCEDTEILNRFLSVCADSLRKAVRRGEGDSNRHYLQYQFQVDDHRVVERIVIHVGGDDDGRACLTIMTPADD